MNIRTADLYIAGLINLDTAVAANEAPSPRAHRIGFGVTACSLSCAVGFVVAGVGAREPLYGCLFAIPLVSALDSLRDALRARRRYVAALAAHRAALATIDAVLRSAAAQEPS